MTRDTSCKVTKHIVILSVVNQMLVIAHSTRQHRQYHTVLRWKAGEERGGGSELSTEPSMALDPHQIEAVGGCGTGAVFSVC